jgi:nucleoside-diphosphate-sugar epimerase
VKIVIIGNGYLGANIFHYFSQNHDVFMISNSNNRFGINTVSISEFELSKNLYSDADLVILSNGLPSEICDNDILLGIRHNVYETVLLIEEFVRLNAKLIIYFSSIHVYGDSLVGDLSENNVCDPSSPYRLNKLYMEKTLKYMSVKKSNTNFLVFRLSNVFGFISDPQTVNWNLFFNYFIISKSNCVDIKINSNGNAYRNILSIHSLCSIINSLTGLELLKFDILNIGSDLTLSLIEYFNLINDLDCNNLNYLSINDSDCLYHHIFNFNIGKLKMRLGVNTIDEHENIKLFLNKTKIG